MPITLYQINGVMVPPVADARLYQMLSGGAVGIVQGCEVTSLGGNQLQIASGWGICLGRVFQVEQETVNAAVSTSGEGCRGGCCLPSMWPVKRPRRR